MTLSFVQLATDGAGKKERTHDYGAEGHLRSVIEQEDERKIVGRYHSAGFAQITSTAGTLNVLAADLNVISTTFVAVRRIVLDVSCISAAVGASWMNNSYFRLWRSTTTPTGGDTLTKRSTDSGATPSTSNFTVRGGASADGTNSTLPITYALPSTNPVREQAFPAMFTNSAAGQWVTDDLILLHQVQSPLILRAGESILVALVNALNNTNYRVTVKMFWEEFTQP